MSEELEKAIKACAKKASEAVHAQEALHYSQAALNAANALLAIKDLSERK